MHKHLPAATWRTMGSNTRQVWPRYTKVSSKRMQFLEPTLVCLVCSVSKMRTSSLAALVIVSMALITCMQPQTHDLLDSRVLQHTFTWHGNVAGLSLR